MAEQGLGFPTERELIVIASAESHLRATAATTFSAAADFDTAPMEEVLESAGATMQPLFGMSEARMFDRSFALASEMGEEIADLSTYYRVRADDEQLDGLAASLHQIDIVQTAYVKPGAEPPIRLDEEVAETEAEPPMPTPDFTARQGYLDAAPGGIDARYAWTVPGGRGTNVGIIDIEGAWRFTHENLTQNQGGVIGGVQSQALGWRNHGTAVVGEFGGDRNSFGVTGIASDANVRAISIFGGLGSAAAIRQAADALQPGDIILIELHRPGPRFDFEGRRDQRGYIAIEWWPDDYAAIRYAVSRGVIVVEAAGNGAEDLSDALYDARPEDFPISWTNPFNPANPSSNAVVVGAGAPPPGTHGRNHGPDRSRLGFSNYGARVDAQGWGREVTTTGGTGERQGDLQGGINEDEWYTDQFSGTSSASPIVVGALACVQGALRAQGRAPLTPIQAIQRLRATGSPQVDASGRPRSQRIGNRPNLRQLIQQPVQCQRYVSYLRRVLVLARRNRRLRECLCYYVCPRARRPRCGRRELRIVRRVHSILDQCPQYRAPVCRILGCTWPDQPDAPPHEEAVPGDTGMGFDDLDLDAAALELELAEVEAFEEEFDLEAEFGDVDEIEADLELAELEASVDEAELNVVTDAEEVPCDQGSVKVVTTVYFPKGRC